jgi:hypothetical protein
MKLKDLSRIIKGSIDVALRCSLAISTDSTSRSYLPRAVYLLSYCLPSSTSLAAPLHRSFFHLCYRILRTCLSMTTWSLHMLIEPHSHGVKGTGTIPVIQHFPECFTKISDSTYNIF